MDPGPWALGGQREERGERVGARNEAPQTSQNDAPRLENEVQRLPKALREASWTPKGPLGTLGGGFGSLLGSSWGALGSSWAALGSLWGCSGGPLGCFGRLLVTLGEHFEVIFLLKRALQRSQAEKTEFTAAFSSIVR